MEVNRAGTPKLDIQMEMNVCAQDSADIKVNSMASVRCEVKLIIGQFVKIA